jgi:hypothetical protein
MKKRTVEKSISEQRKISEIHEIRLIQNEKGWFVNFVRN